MGNSALAFVVPNMKHQIFEQFPTIIELKEQYDSTKVLNEIKSIPEINQESVELIKKNNVNIVYSGLISPQILEKLSQADIFKDIIRFNFNSNVISDLKSSTYGRIESMESVYSLSGHDKVALDKEQHNQLIYSGLYVFSLLLTLILLWSVLSLSFEKNKNDIKAIVLSGGDLKFVIKNLTKKVLKFSFKAWIIALFLFLPLFYLMISSFGINFQNLDLLNIFWVLFLPLVLVLFSTWLMVSKLVVTQFKT